MAETNELFPVTGPESDDVTDRYARSNILRDENGATFYANYQFDVNLFPENPTDGYHIVGAGEEGRLDLISFQYYGTTELDWVIAIANDIPDLIRGFEAGDALRIPDAEAVFSKVLSSTRLRSFVRR